MKKLSLVFILAGIFASCAKESDKGSGGPAAPGGVNSKISAPASQTLIGQSALFESSFKQTKDSRISNTTDLGVLAISQLSGVTSTPEAKSELKTKTDIVSTAIHRSACQIKLSPSSSANTGSQIAASFKPFALKISGANCPIEISMKMTMSGINGGTICSDKPGTFSCQFIVDVNMTYLVRNEELKKSLQVTSGHINMSFAMDQTSPSKDNQMDMNIKAKADIDLKAVDLSDQAYLISGSQEFKMQMTSQAQTPDTSPEENAAPQILGGMTEQLHYRADSTGVESSLNSSIVFNGSAAPEEIYVVDGVSVTAEAYSSERAKFANSMMEFSVQKNP